MINTCADRDTEHIRRLYNFRELQHMYLYSAPAYVYYVKHIPSGKFYYGSRYKHIRSNTWPEHDLWHKYFSSSKELASLLKETGKDSFEYAILFTSNNPTECFECEQTLIKEHLNDPLCINKRYFNSASGSSVFCTFGKTLSTKGLPKSEETRHRMSKPKSAAHRRAISESQKLSGGNGPKRHSKETKLKISESGRGKTHSLETKLLMSKAQKGIPKPTIECPVCHKVGGTGPMHRFHLTNCKFKE